MGDEPGWAPQLVESSVSDRILLSYEDRRESQFADCTYNTATAKGWFVVSSVEPIVGTSRIRVESTVWVLDASDSTHQHRYVLVGQEWDVECNLPTLSGCTSSTLLFPPG